MANINIIPPKEKPERSLFDTLCVASPTALEEACFSMPAVRAFKNLNPSQKLVLLCAEGQTPLWNTLSCVDQIITYPRKSSANEIAKILRAQTEPFQASLAWGSLNTTRAFYKAKIKHRLGWKEKETEKYFTQAIDKDDKKGPITHRVQDYLSFLNKLGLNAFTKESFSTSPLDPAPEKPTILLVPNSKFGDSYSCPIENFSKIIKFLQKQIREINWIIIFDKIDAHTKIQAYELQTILGEQNPYYDLENDIEELISAVIPSASAMLACDSHTAHLAAIFSLPALVIFGPNEPRWKRPLGKQSHVIRRHVPCSPCFMSKCPIDHRCMNDLQADKIVSLLISTLKRRGHALEINPDQRTIRSKYLLKRYLLRRRKKIKGTRKRRYLSRR